MSFQVISFSPQHLLMLLKKVSQHLIPVKMKKLDLLLILPYSNLSCKKLQADVKAACASFATSSQVQSIADQQTKLERDMQTLTAKVECYGLKIRTSSIYLFPQ